jgi:Amidohydrolase
MFETIKNAATYLRLQLNRLDFSKKPRYQGPLIDAMMQFNANRTAAELLAKMDQHGITQMMIFARQQNPADSTQHVIDIKAADPDRFVLGAPKAFDHRDDLKPKFVEQTLQGVDSGLYAFIGELQCVHADKHKGTWGNETTLRGERWINPLAPNFLALMDQLDGRGIPVMVHWEFYDWERDHPAFFELFRLYPHITFIIPHGGFGRAEYNNEILTRFDNVYLTLSKKDLIHIGRYWFTWRGFWLNANGPTSKAKQSKLGYAVVDSDGKLNYQWRHIMLKWPDRLLFATDCHKRWRWQHYDLIIDTWREILGQLPEDVAEQIAYKNAQKLFVC